MSSSTLLLMSWTPSLQDDTKGYRKGHEGSTKKNGVQHDYNEHLAHQGSYLQGLDYGNPQCKFHGYIDSRDGRDSSSPQSGKYLHGLSYYYSICIATFHHRWEGKENKGVDFYCTDFKLEFVIFQVHLELNYCPFGTERGFLNSFDSDFILNGLEKALNSGISENDVDPAKLAVQKRKEVIRRGVLSVTLVPKILLRACHLLCNAAAINGAVCSLQKHVRSAQSGKTCTYEYKDRFWGSKSGGNKSDAKPSFSDISKAKACILAKAQASKASSKAKVQACGSKGRVQTSGSKAKVQTLGSKAKVQTSPKTLIVKSLAPITNFVLGLANAKTWNAILSKTFEVKIPTIMTCMEEKKGKRRLWVEDDFTFLYNYLPSTDNDITDKDNTDEDCIHESNSSMVKLANLQLQLANLLAFAACKFACICICDEVFSIWKAFGGNTRDLGSFGEETDKTMNLHQHLSRISTQKLETASQITRDAVTTHLKTASQDLRGDPITTWEDLTTRFLAQFFPPGRTVKVRNDILVFQQHHEESLSKA
ncbi:putative retrotransposon protein [Tanacetum coccineum]